MSSSTTRTTEPTVSPKFLLSAVLMAMSPLAFGQDPVVHTTWAQAESRQSSSPTGDLVVRSARVTSRDSPSIGGRNHDRTFGCSSLARSSRDAGVKLAESTPDVNREKDRSVMAVSLLDAAATVRRVSACCIAR